MRIFSGRRLYKKRIPYKMNIRMWNEKDALGY